MSLVSLVLAGRRAVGEWRRRRQAYAELMALDDRQLADIGMHRSQIPGLAAESVGRRPKPEPQYAGPRAWLALLHPHI